jgi:phenylalanine-4-hydroxylase
MQTIPPCPVPIAIDGSIEQPLSYYNVDDHEVWKTLFLKQQAILQTTVCSEFLDGLKHLPFNEKKVPDVQKISKKLQRISRFSLVCVGGLISSQLFFQHLAHRRFTVGWFVRKHHQMDYLEEPDLFHDLFGHVPLLTHQFYSDIMQLVGIQGLEIMKRFSHDNEMRETISNALLRLYWFTIEFGLIKNAQNELKVYGAGIASSSKEVPHALYDKTVLRLEFNQPEQLEYIVRTRYFINDVQKIYFVIPDFQFLYTIFQQDNLIEQIVMAREKGLLNPDEIQALWPI